MMCVKTKIKSNHESAMNFFKCRLEASWVVRVTMLSGKSFHRGTMLIKKEFKNLSNKKKNTHIAAIYSTTAIDHALNQIL